jgi:SSS family solute:Na+ symporter
LISWIEGKGKDHPKAIRLTGMRMVTDPVFNAAAFGILGITAALYIIFW